MTDDDDDKRLPLHAYADLFPILLAALLTAAAIGMYFVQFSVGSGEPEAPPSPPPAANHGEVSIGIGEGSTIHPVHPVEAPGDDPSPDGAKAHP
ncbi:MAG: hypothetical protein JSR60_03540 [Proteobacteria bacterium]|nr:hypothetical protein [Pseudomonadota bacterium]